MGCRYFDRACKNCPWPPGAQPASNEMERTCHGNPKAICEARRLGGSAAIELGQLSDIATRKFVGRQGFRSSEDRERKIHLHFSHRSRRYSARDRRNKEHTLLARRSQRRI